MMMIGVKITILSLRSLEILTLMYFYLH